VLAISEKCRLIPEFPPRIEVKPYMPKIHQNADSAKRGRLPSVVWILSWVSFFADVSSEMVYPLLPLFMIGILGSSKTQLGAMEGGAVFIVAIMSAVAGIRSDRKGGREGRVKWIRWGYGLPVLGKSMIALSTVWPLVVGGRFLDRFGKGLRGAPRDALIADAVSEEQRGGAFGLHRAFDTAGAIVGVLLAAFLLWWLTGTPQSDVSGEAMSAATETPAWIYRVIFGVGAALGLASLMLTFMVKESEAPRQTDAIDSASTGGDKETIDAKSPETKAWAKLPAAYWYVLAVLGLFSLANSSDTFLLLRARDLGYSPWAVVTVYAFYNLFYSLLSYPAGALSDRIGRWRIIIVGWIIYACVYAGLALLPASQAWGVWPLMAIYGVYMALTDGVGKALIVDHTPSDCRGSAMGIFYGLTGLTTLIASLGAGILWDHFGAPAALLMGSGFAILAIIALMLAGKLAAPLRQPR
jgi:MFS family permease